MWTQTGEILTGAIHRVTVENARASVANAWCLIAKTARLFTKTSSETTCTLAVEVVRGEVLASGVVQTWLIKRAKRGRLVAVLALIAIGAFAEVICFVQIEVEWVAGAKLATNGSICYFV